MFDMKIGDKTKKSNFFEKVAFLKVAPARIELATPGFSVLCSTN